MIPVCEPTPIGNMSKYVNECLNTNWISSNGKFIDEFEQKFAEYCGCKHGISTTNGTTALHLALVALGIKEGMEVIVPNFTMIATANAVVYTGAKPVFVDAELETWNMDTDKIEAKITDKTKAIIVVHTYGCPIDMDRIDEIAEKHNLYVIEDAAEAHGATFKGRKTGSLGDIACFSFYGNKILTTGEGGMVVTNSDKLAKACRSYKNHCFGEPRFIHKNTGFNYRMTNIQAAIGLSQVEYADVLVNSRVFNAAIYNSQLKNAEGIILPPECPKGKNVYWMYGILVNKKDNVMSILNHMGIQTRSFFYPMHKQPCFKHLVNKDDKYPNSNYLFEHGLYIPSSSHLKMETLIEVAFKVKQAVLLAK